MMKKQKTRLKSKKTNERSNYFASQRNPYENPLFLERSLQTGILTSDWLTRLNKIIHKFN